MATATAPKLRDAARSRGALLDAAERLFAERGYHAASMNEIGAAAGLSRGTPNYFFGSKDALYAAVLERVFAERERATVAAFAPVREWAAGSGDGAVLDAALARAVRGYMEFLLDRPAFVRLIAWEELAGGRRLRSVPRESRAMQDAFGELRRAGRRRGLRAFRVEDAVMLFVSLTFSPLTQRNTFMASLGRDLADPVTLRRHVKLVVAQLMHLVGPR